MPADRFKLTQYEARMIHAAAHFGIPPECPSDLAGLVKRLDEFALTGEAPAPASSPSQEAGGDAWAQFIESMVERRNGYVAREAEERAAGRHGETQEVAARSRRLLLDHLIPHAESIVDRLAASPEGEPEQAYVRWRHDPAPKEALMRAAARSGEEVTRVSAGAIQSHLRAEGWEIASINPPPTCAPRPPAVQEGSGEPDGERARFAREVLAAVGLEPNDEEIEDVLRAVGRRRFLAGSPAPVPSTGGGEVPRERDTLLNRGNVIAQSVRNAFDLNCAGQVDVYTLAAEVKRLELWARDVRDSAVSERDPAEPAGDEGEGA